MGFNFLGFNFLLGCFWVGAEVDADLLTIMHLSRSAEDVWFVLNTVV